MDRRSRQRRAHGRRKRRRPWEPEIDVLELLDLRDMAVSVDHHVAAAARLRRNRAGRAATVPMYDPDQTVADLELDELRQRTAELAVVVVAGDSEHRCDLRQ